MKKILTDTVKKKFKPIYTEGKAQLKKNKNNEQQTRKISSQADVGGVER